MIVDATDLPQSARQTFATLKRIGESKGSQSDDYPTICSFLAMECYMPVGEPGNIASTVLAHLTRVIDAPIIDFDRFKEDPDLIARYMHGLDSLLQLSRIPDIASSPKCMLLLNTASCIQGSTMSFNGRKKDPSFLMRRCVEETRHFIREFHKAQEKSNAPNYSAPFEYRYWSWQMALIEWLETPSRWSINAEAKRTALLKRRPELNPGPLLDPNNGFTKINAKIKLYANLLNLKSIKKKQ